MTKKHLISLFLFFPFAIVFAHSIIPHHLHEEAAIRHGEYHDDDHDDIDDNLLAQAFSHFQHDQVNGVLYETVAPALQWSKVSFDNA